MVDTGIYLSERGSTWNKFNITNALQIGIDLVNNPDLAYAKGRVNIILNKYTNMISGAAFTDQEFQRYLGQFANVMNTGDLNEQKIQALYDGVTNELDTWVNIKTGLTSYKDLVTSDLLPEYEMEVVDSRVSDSDWDSF